MLKGRALPPPLLFAVVPTISHPSKGKKEIVSREGEGCCVLQFPLSSQERCGNQVGFTQKYQEVIINIYYSSEFFHCPSKAAS